MEEVCYFCLLIENISMKSNYIVKQFATNFDLCQHFHSKHALWNQHNPLTLLYCCLTLETLLITCKYVGGRCWMLQWRTHITAAILLELILDDVGGLDFFSVSLLGSKGGSDNNSTSAGCVGDSLGSWHVSSGY